MKRAPEGYRGGPMFSAHIAPLLEPLLFAPAFIAVGWALVNAWRGGPSPLKEHHD